MVHAQVLFLFFTHCDVLLFHSLSIFFLLSNDNAADNIFSLPLLIILLSDNFKCFSIFFLLHDDKLQSFYTAFFLNVIDFCIFFSGFYNICTYRFTVKFYYSFIIFFHLALYIKSNDTLRKFLFKKRVLFSLLKLCKFAICLNNKLICMKIQFEFKHFSFTIDISRANWVF